MAEKKVKTRIQQKHDIEANWIKAGSNKKADGTSKEPFVPLAGEFIIYEPDANYDYPLFKIGDGKTSVTELPFAINPHEHSGYAEDGHKHTKEDVTDLATVAYTGSYNDLTDKPAIPEAVTVDTSLSSTSTNPTQNKVVTAALANKVDKTTDAVQCIKGGLVVGKDSVTNVAATGKGRIMFTGQTNPLIGLQAIDESDAAKTPYYVQALASDDSLYIGPTSTKALKFDPEGNMHSPANLEIAGTIKESGKTLAEKYVAINTFSTGASASTLAAGSNATATATWNATDKKINFTFGIPKGATGEKGEKGDKGDKGDTGATGVGIKSVTQTTTSTADGGENVITVTKTDNSTSTFKVKNGSKGSTGATGASSEWYTGTGVTGTSKTATVFSSSGVSTATVGDMYLNTSTYNVYRCSTAGAASVAKWVYVCNIKGAAGSNGTNGTNGKDGTSVTITNVSQNNSAGGTSTITFSDGKTLSIKNGTTPTIDAADGSNINTVGTPSVTASTSGTTTTFTFNNLKGTKGDKGDKGDPGSPGKDGTSVTITNVSQNNSAGGTSTITFSDGNTLSIKNGTNGADGTILDYEEFSIAIKKQDGSDVTGALEHNGAYKIVAGGATCNFTMPSAVVTQTEQSSGTTDYYILASAQASPTSGTAYGAKYNTAIKLNGSGQITATSFNATSDKRLKENIIGYEYEKSILDLPVYKYNFISDTEKKVHIGCLAQDLQEICPEAVNEDSNGYLSIQENKLVYLLLEEVKRLRQELNEVKNGGK